MRINTWSLKSHDKPNNVPHLKTLLISTLIFSPSAFAQSAPPVAPVREVVDTYFGQRVSDPYRWLEARGPEFDTWLKAQADYADWTLRKLPMRSSLLARFTALSSASTSVANVQRSGENYFSMRREPGETDYSLYVRRGLAGTDRLLPPVAALSHGAKRNSIATYNVSPDGHYVAYLVAPGGGEYGELRILEVATGHDLGDRIAETRWSAGEWLPDSKSIAYIAFQKLAPGAAPADRLKKTRVLVHRLGTSEASDEPLFGFGVDSAINSAITMLPSLSIPHGSRYAFIRQNSGVEPGSEIYMVPVPALTRRPVPWKRLAAMDDDISEVWVHGDDLFLKTFKDAPRSKIVRTSATKPDLKDAELVFSSKDGVVADGGVARDAFYVQSLSRSVSQVHRIPYGSTGAERVPLPYEASAELALVEPERDGALMDVVSFTRSSRIVQYDPARRVSADTHLRPAVPVDMSSIVAKSVMVPSWDGTKVPMNILYRKGLKFDGTHPTIIEGYGAYGRESQSPVFAVNQLPWLERGGVYAEIGVRGGGEFGEEWHLAGKGKNKPNTWKDFIAGAEYLVREKYTSAAHLAGRGTSAGGILIGNAVVERPDLFRAAIINVGITNALRYEFTPNGPANIPEFGSVTTEQGFRDLLAMDAYTKIRRGVKYPAVLLITGANDPRVEPWITAKMTAALQAATSSGRPVLLRVDYDAGHGTGLSSEQLARQRADMYAFLFRQLSEL